jgi:hypothetical protein
MEISMRKITIWQLASSENRRDIEGEGASMNQETVTVLYPVVILSDTPSLLLHFTHQKPVLGASHTPREGISHRVNTSKGFFRNHC